MDQSINSAVWKHALHMNTKPMTTEAPYSVLRYLRSILHQDGAFVYLKLDAQHYLLESGGSLAYLSGESFNASAPIDQQFPSLSGLLPAIDIPVVILSVEIVRSQYVDLHIYYDMGNQWALLLDTTEFSTRLQKKRQDRLRSAIPRDNC